MQANDIGRILGIMAALGLVVFIIVQVINFASNPSGSDEDTDDATSSVDAGVTLGDYTTPTSRVTMIRKGSVIALEDHRQVRISATENQRVFELIRGYDGAVIEKQVYENTPQAYEEFLESLSFYGFENQQEGRFESEIGICPQGRQTIIQLIDNREQVLRSWATSCSDEHGNLAGNTRQIRALFQKQIPDYTQLMRGVRL